MTNKDEAIRAAFEVWAKSEGHTNFMRMAGDPKQYDDLILRAQYHAYCATSHIAPDATGCVHRMADARNPVVESGYVCIDCGAVFAAADHSAAPDAAAIQAEGDERTKFEAWYHSTCTPGLRWLIEYTECKNDDGTYAQGWMQRMWMGWEGRAKASPAIAPEARELPLLPEPTVEGTVMHPELKICYRAPVHYTAEQVREAQRAAIAMHQSVSNRGGVNPGVYETAPQIECIRCEGRGNHVILDDSRQAVDVTCAVCSGTGRMAVSTAAAEPVPTAWGGITKDEARQIYRLWQHCEETPMGLFMRFKAAATKLAPASQSASEAVGDLESAIIGLASPPSTSMFGHSLDYKEGFRTACHAAAELVAAYYAAPAASEAVGVPDDAIAKCKRILALVDDYVDAMNVGGVEKARHARTALRVALIDSFAALARGTGSQHDADALADMEARKDAAYYERNQVVAALAKCFPSGVARTAIEGWSEDWHGCVYIDLPTGQASWHFHDSQAHLFAGIPAYTGKWDGHTTEAKYERLAALPAEQSAPPVPPLSSCIPPFAEPAG